MTLTMKKAMQVGVYSMYEMKYKFSLSVFSLVLSLSYC
jgi:hypothetical protein